jgi:hypothetical protein
VKEKLNVLSGLIATAALITVAVLANMLMYASMYDYGKYSLHVLVACVLALIPLEVYK